MKKFVKFYNVTNEDDDITILYEATENGHVNIMQGDYYHDKIDYKIEGYLSRYKSSEYTLQKVEYQCEDYDDLLAYKDEDEILDILNKKMGE